MVAFTSTVSAFVTCDIPAIPDDHADEGKRERWEKSARQVPVTANMPVWSFILNYFMS